MVFAQIKALFFPTLRTKVRSFESYSSKIPSTKLMDAMVQFRLCPSTDKVCFTPNRTPVAPLKHQRVKMRLTTSSSTSLGTSMRLKVECIEVTLFRNPMLWCLLLKENSFHMPCVK